MVRPVWIAALSAVLVFALATPAAAQGGSSTATLSGVVTDRDGGVIPGATVTVKNTATGETQNTVTNEAVMGLVGITQKHRAGDFSPRATLRPENGGAHVTAE